MAKGSIIGKNAEDFAKRAQDSDFTDMVEKEIIPILNPNKNMKIADFCTGSGNIIPFLINKVKTFTAIDDSPEMIEIMTKKYGRYANLIIKKEDVTNLNIPTEEYDTVIIKFSLHHIKKGQEVLNEAFKILKPNGKLIIIDMVFKSTLLIKLLEPFWKLKKTISHGTHELHCKYRNEKEIEHLIEKTNFKILEKKILQSKKENYRDKHYPTKIYVLEKIKQ